MSTSKNQHLTDIIGLL